MGLAVEIQLKDWKIKRDDDKGVTKVCGTYALMHGQTELATKGFNDGYGEMEFPFSSDLITASQELEKKIKAEITALLG